MPPGDISVIALLSYKAAMASASEGYASRTAHNLVIFNTCAMLSGTFESFSAPRALLTDVNSRTSIPSPLLSTNSMLPRCSTMYRWDGTSC